MRLLDLFCGAGGATVGYHRAGFDEIVGVDIKPQPRYPFTFVLGDALEYVRDHGREFDAIHASPPCQLHSNGRNYNGRKARGTDGWIDLVGPTFIALASLTVPTVIENVIGASHLFSRSIVVCGTALGLRVQRHRLFESNIVLLQPVPCNHQPYDVSVRRNRSYYLLAYRDVYTKKGLSVRRPSFCNIDEARKAMGIDWMTTEELGEAIPPAYTEFIGRQLIAALVPA